MNEITGNSWKRILIVEDDELSNKVMSLQLKKFFKIDAAVNGTHALELFKKFKYDLILMDINLGAEKNGIEVMKEIKATERGKNIPVVAITAYPHFTDRVIFLKSGFDSYISRPWSADNLIKCITDTLKDR